MLNFPMGAGADLVRKNLETQLSLMTSMSGRLFNTSLQLGELNRQAGRRLIEESADDMQKALQLRTLADVQSFVGEQTQMTVERMRGYWQNVQQITAQNLTVGLPGAPDDGELVQPEHGVQAGQDVQEQDEEDTQQASSAPGKHPHEVDVQPSPLVEKLVAAVAVEPAKTGARPR